MILANEKILADPATVNSTRLKKNAWKKALLKVQVKVLLLYFKF